MKKSLKSTVNETGTIQTKLSRFLMSYRTTPHTTIEETPPELFLRRSIQTRLDPLKPNLKDKVSQKQEDQKRFHDNPTTKTRKFSPEQKVLVENLRNATPKWISGKIITKTGPLSYKVEIDGVIHRRHVDQKEDPILLPSIIFLRARRFFFFFVSFIFIAHFFRGLAGACMNPRSFLFLCIHLFVQ